MKLSSISLSFYNSYSFSRGRTIVWQSLSLKKCFSIFLNRFLDSADSFIPFDSFKAFSKYSLAVIEFPYVSTRFNEKSLTIHKNAGKN